MGFFGLFRRKKVTSTKASDEIRGVPAARPQPSAQEADVHIVRGPAMRTGVPPPLPQATPPTIVVDPIAITTVTPENFAELAARIAPDRASLMETASSPAAHGKLLVDEHADSQGLYALVLPGMDRTIALREVEGRGWEALYQGTSCGVYPTMFGAQLIALMNGVHDETLTDAQREELTLMVASSFQDAT